MGLLKSYPFLKKSQMLILFPWIINENVEAFLSIYRVLSDFLCAKYSLLYAHLWARQIDIG